LWKEIAPELVHVEMLRVVDMATLMLACDAFGQYQEAKQAIYRPMNPITGKRVRRSLEQYLSGLDPWIDIASMDPVELYRLRRNSQTAPELAVMKSAWATYKGYMAEFGLSPAARNRISVPVPEEKSDPMEDLLNGQA